MKTLRDIFAWVLILSGVFLAYSVLTVMLVFFVGIAVLMCMPK